jgi:hypothetical protein
MENKIPLFLKKWFKKQGDYCPKDQLDIFIVNNFNGDMQDEAIAFVDQLINKKWMRQITKDKKEFLAVTGYGIGMLKKLV